MTLRIIRAGLQTTIQAAPRTGLRHFGVPWAGPADALSMSLANRLVGNEAGAPALEITLAGLELEFQEDLAFSLTGAPCEATIGVTSIELHKTIFAKAGDILKLGPSVGGCRNYLAFAGQLEASEFLGSAATYLAGQFGGLEGRSLRDGDVLRVSSLRDCSYTETPRQLRPYFSDCVMLQVCQGPDFQTLTSAADGSLFHDEFAVTQRASRMGVELKGSALETNDQDDRPSAAVFPGSIQLPPGGNPFILLADAQTTGGYPHILQVIRSDRFQLGQLRPGAKVRFIKRTADEAAGRLRARWEAYSDWLAEPSI